MENDEPKNETAEIDVPRALAALAHVVGALDARTRELAEGQRVQTETMTAMVDAQELIMVNHGRAFGRISEILISLGADITGPEISELRKLFEMPSPPES